MPTARSHPKKTQARHPRAAGGDYGFPHNPHGTNAWDAELFVKDYGFTPAEALRALTQYGGQMVIMQNGRFHKRDRAVS